MDGVWQKFFSEKVEYCESPLGGYGVFAKQDIAEDELVMKISKHLVLSPRSCAASQILAQHSEFPQLLAIALLVERSLGAKSKFAFYIDLLDKVALPDVPGFWSEEEQNWLRGTNIHVWVVPSLEDIREHYNEGQQELFPSLQQYFPQGVSFDDFLKACLLVSSRAFDVDDFHGLAFSPGACLFNHSDRETVHFQSDSSMSSDNSENVCEIRTVKSVSAGSELYNTYGEEPNGTLLGRYGFCIWNNVHDIVDFDEEIEEFAESRNKHQVLAERRDLLEDQAAERNDAELAFVGVINAPQRPRISPGLISVAAVLHMDPTALAQRLALSRLRKYAFSENSTEISQLLQSETHQRKRVALTAVGSEKLLLEPFVNM